MSTTEENLEQLFQAIWSNNEGYVHLPTRAKDGTWKKVWFSWPLHKPHVVKHVMRATSESKEVFFAPAIFKETTFEKSGVLGTACLWADFDDGTAPTDWSELPMAIPEPSVRVQTSTPGNEHAYWLLDSFTTDHDYIEQKNRALAYTLNSDTACWNVNRLLRVPTGINFGYSKPERKGKTYEVLIAELVPERVYSSVDFLA